MKTFMVEVNAVPLPECEHYAELESATVKVIAMADTIEAAQARACAYIALQRWQLQAFVKTLELPALDPRGLDIYEGLLYRSAAKHGIAADFLAVPRMGGRIGDPVRIVRMRYP